MAAEQNQRLAALSREATRLNVALEQQTAERAASRADSGRRLARRTASPKPGA